MHIWRRMVNMVARYVTDSPDIRADIIDLLAADIAYFIRAELADIDDTGFSELKRCATVHARRFYFLCNSMLPSALGASDKEICRRR